MSERLETTDLRLEWHNDGQWITQTTAVWPDTDKGLADANAYVAITDARGDGGNHRIARVTRTVQPLDRPKPAVELPTVPTLGWLTYGGGADKAFGKFRSGDITESRHAMSSDAPIVIEVGSSGTKINAQFHVTAFTPATAVPTEALDALRRVGKTFAGSRTTTGDALRTFLLAVDKAAQ